MTNLTHCGFVVQDSRIKHQVAEMVEMVVVVEEEEEEEEEDYQGWQDLAETQTIETMVQS